MSVLIKYPPSSEKAKDQQTLQFTMCHSQKKFWTSIYKGNSTCQLGNYSENVEKFEYQFHFFIFFHFMKLS